MCAVAGAGSRLDNLDLAEYVMARGARIHIAGTDLEIAFLADGGDLYAWLCKCGICIARTHVAGAALPLDTALVRQGGSADVRLVVGERADGVAWTVDHQEGGGIDAMPRKTVSL